MVVRLLIGNFWNMTKPNIKALLLSESQIESFRNGQKIDKGMGEFLNNTAGMEYNEATGHLTASFRTIKLKKVHHTVRKGTQDSVTDEKFALLFYSDFEIGHNDFKSSIWVMSHPVVAIVNISQKTQVSSTILWHDAFVDSIGTVFHTPDQVSWNKLAKALDNAFETSTGRGLTPDNLHCLAEKLFKKPLSSSIDDSLIVSWTTFCKEKLNDRTFSFWEWFYENLELTRSYLREPWADGKIVGFISKQNMECLLRGTPKGTFILRFSDSELGRCKIVI